MSYRGPKSALGAWLLLGVWIYCLYRFGKSTNWSWVGIAVCAFFGFLFFAAAAYLWISTIREGKRVMKMKPEELFPSDMGRRPE
jgi:hypothetical protein